MAIPSFFGAYYIAPLFSPQRPPWGSPRSENVAPAAAPEVPRNEGHGLDRRPQGPVNSGEFQGLLASRTTCCCFSWGKHAKMIGFRWSYKQQWWFYKQKWWFFQLK